jgi:hypothetical protein
MSFFDEVRSTFLASDPVTERDGRDAALVKKIKAAVLDAARRGERRVTVEVPQSKCSCPTDAEVDAMARRDARAIASSYRSADEDALYAQLRCAASYGVVSQWQSRIQRGVDPKMRVRLVFSAKTYPGVPPEDPVVYTINISGWAE